MVLCGGIKLAELLCVHRHLYFLSLVNQLASLEIAGAKEQICACLVVKCSWVSNKFVHKEMDQEQFSGNFQ